METCGIDAVIRSKLLYAMETMELTKGQRDRIDAFQMKGHRRILGIPPTHIDRSWTNELVKKEVEKHTKKKYTTFSAQWEKAKISLLGHVLRADQNDPMHQVLFEGSAKYPRIVGRRRSGRPRMNWLELTMETAFRKIPREDNQNVQFRLMKNGCYNMEHINEVIKAAQKRTTPFETKPKKSGNDFIFGIPNEEIDRIFQRPQTESISESSAPHAASFVSGGNLLPWQDTINT